MTVLKKSTSRTIALALSIAWVIVIGARALDRWPVMPLDMSPRNPEIAAAYEQAVYRHVTRAVILALTVPALLGGLLVLRRRALEGGGARISAVKPARILLMRHAEKTGDPQDIHLSDEGHARAQRLATYIPATFGQPDAIFAAARSKHSDRSMETMEPLAVTTGVTLNTSYKDDDYESLIATLTSEPGLAGKTVVICWHHSDLPKIARALGAPAGSYPDPWDPEVFNVILDVRSSPEGSVTLEQIVEPF